LCRGREGGGRKAGRQRLTVPGTTGLPGRRGKKKSDARKGGPGWCVSLIRRKGGKKRRGSEVITGKGGT